MVKYVRYIHAELQVLAFGNSNRFAESHIKVPTAQAVDPVKPEVAASSGKRILQYDVVVFICGCKKGAL